MADSDPPTPPPPSDHKNPQSSSDSEHKSIPFTKSSSSSDPIDASSDTCTSHQISSPIREDFIKSLPESIKENHNAKIEKLFEDCSDNKPDKFDTPNFERSIPKLIKDEPAAPKSFKRVLPTANLIPSPSKTGQTVVRAGLYDETETHMMCLKHFKEYLNGSETFPEFKTNVEGCFRNMDDFWKEIVACLDPCGRAKAPITSGDDNVASTSSGVEKSIQDSSAGVASDSSDKEPPSKRIKTTDI